MPFLYVVAFTVGVFTVCFDVAYQACLPPAGLPRSACRRQQHVGDHPLGRPNLRPGLSAAPSSHCSQAPIAVLASALFYAISAVSVSRIRRCRNHLIKGGVDRHASGSWSMGCGSSSATVPCGRSRWLTCIYQFSFTALTTVYLLFLSRTLELPGAAPRSGPRRVRSGGSWSARCCPRGYPDASATAGSSCFAALTSDLVMLGTSVLHGSGPGVIATPDHHQRPIRDVEPIRRHLRDRHPAGRSRH